MKFKYKLHPSFCVFENDDENQIFEASDLDNGDYLITWIENGEEYNVIFTSEDVFESIAEGIWIPLKEEQERE